MRFTPHKYQEEAIDFMAENDFGAIFADPGCGKTVVTLSALPLFEAFEGHMKALIIAPLRVVMSTWPEEIEQWEHTRHLKYQILRGKTKKIDLSNDIFLVNPHNLKTVFEQKESKQLNVLILDESTQFKNWASKRVKLLKKHLRQFNHRYILTGTPAPNGLLDLFAQVFLVDGGMAFGKAITRFKQRYFRPTDYMEYNWAPKDGAEEEIYKAIAPISFRIDGERELELPPFVYKTEWVDMPSKALKQYAEFEKELFLQLEEEEALSAVSASVAYGKCRQLANGMFYIGDPALGDVEVKQLHSAKLEVVKEVVNELYGKPALVVYNYRHELEALQKLFDGAPYIGGGVSAERGDELVRAWNNDELPVLLLHPASVSFGLNMQKGSGRHIIWFSLTDNLEHYIQLNRRIRRQGVSSTVFVVHIAARGTIDEALLSLLKQKDKTQKSLLDALRDYKEEQS